MWFWVFILVMDLLIPLCMIGMGKYFMTKAPKEINRVFGYRTAMSMKNKDTWEFAHRHCGKTWWRCGLILLPLSIIPLLFVFGKDADTVGNTGGIVNFMQIIPLIASIIPTEIALRRTFDKDGNRRE